jgi:hypothetical protein
LLIDILFTKNDIAAEIAREVSQLDLLEQQILLTKLRVRRLKLKNSQKVTRNPEGLRKPILKQIDKWKHAAIPKSQSLGPNS